MPWAWFDCAVQRSCTTIVVTFPGLLPTSCAGRSSRKGRTRLQRRSDSLQVGVHKCLRQDNDPIWVRPAVKPRGCINTWTAITWWSDGKGEAMDDLRKCGDQLAMIQQRLASKGAQNT